MDNAKHLDTAFHLSMLREKDIALAQQEMELANLRDRIEFAERDFAATITDLNKMI